MMSKSNITLIGMPGVGKTSIGKVLARKLKLRFIDTDILIQNHAKKPLQTVLNQEGDSALLALEEDIILKLKHISNTLISPGGSAIYSERAMTHLQSLSMIVYLKDSLENIQSRISNLQTRGIVGLKNKTLAELFKEREALYVRYADITVPVSTSLSDQALYQTIISHYKKGA